MYKNRSISSSGGLGIAGSTGATGMTGATGVGVAGASGISPLITANMVHYLNNSGANGGVKFNANAKIRVDILKIFTDCTSTAQLFSNTGSITNKEGLATPHIVWTTNVSASVNAGIPAATP